MPTVIERSSFMHALHSSCCEPAAADYVRSTWPAWMPRLAFTESLRGDVLVVIFLRGAADAINIIVPHGEEAYYAKRPTLAVPRPDDAKAPEAERVIDLDGFFGFHPLLRPLLPIWEQGHLAPIHACGAPDESRSLAQAHRTQWGSVSRIQCREVAIDPS